MTTAVSLPPGSPCGSDLDESWHDAATDDKAAEGEELDPVVSELTDSIDDLGRLLSSTAQAPAWEARQNRFPVEPTDGKEEEGLVYYSSRASTSSSEESSGVGSAAGTPTSLSAEEFTWTPATPPQSVSLRDKEKGAAATAVVDLRRWSVMSTASVQRPGDATNCDCTAIAFATLRGSKARKKLKALREQDDSYQKCVQNAPDSPDSGFESGCSSTESSPRTPPGHKRPNSATAILPKSPTKGSLRQRGTGRKRSLGLLLDSFMYKMFRIQRSVKPTSTAPTGAAAATATADKTGEGSKENDISYSPRWRDDPTDEASPMARRTPVDSPNTLSQELNRLRIQNPEPFGHSTPVQLRQPPQTHVSPVCKIDFDNLEDSCELSTSHSHSAASVSLTKSLSSVAKVTHSMPPLPSVPVSVAGKLANTPRFHFPTGQPVSKAQNDEILRRVQGIFAARPQLPPSGFDEVCRQMGLPVYTKKAVYEACCQVAHLPPADNPCISFAQFADYWNRMTTGSHDEASRFVFTLSVAKTGLPARTYLTKEDFHSILYDLIETYPGLRFLCDATQFHTRYVEVVIVRIFWNCNRSWSGKLSILELRRSNFLETMHMLEETDEINKITDYFSYEHFYVIYCKFWEIDTKHELILTRDSMRRHCSGALTDRIIDRIFSPAVNRVSQRPVNRRGPVRPEHIETIGFEEFVAFLLAEEDKRHPTAIEYWFRCLDLDGDGVISIYEMELFYNDIVEKIHSKNYETLEFNDVLCQLYDLVSPEEDGKITLRDLKRCGLAHRFFNTFVNYIKHIEQESADGERASVKMNGDKEMSDWDHFCAVEYEMLMAEADQDRNGNDEAYNVDLDDDDELTQEATFGMDSNVVSALSVDDSQY